MKKEYICMDFSLLVRVSQTPVRCTRWGPSQPGFLLIDFAVTTGIKFCNLTGLGWWGRAVYRLPLYIYIYSVKAIVFRFSIFTCIQKERLGSRLVKKICASELTGVASPPYL